MRGPNPEQKLAIEHSGSVLLSAGAGSGKTFVLVEHFVYLLKTFIEKNNVKDPIELEERIRSYFSKRVFMTFTKKAAGELQLRLVNRLEICVESEELPNQFVEIVKRNLDYLTVTTIHGYCFKLLSSGLFKDFNPSTAIVGNVELGAKISKLVKHWLNENRNSLHEDFEELLIQKDSLIESMTQIFSSPELRMMWDKFDVDEQQSLSELMVKILKLEEINIDIKRFDPEDYLEDKKKKPAYVSFFKTFVNYILPLDLESMEGMVQVQNFFESGNKMPRIIAKSTPDAIVEYNENLKKLKAFVNDIIKSFVEYGSHFESVIKKKAILIKNVFDYIERTYESISGYTFSDLEYYVLKGLENESVKKKVSESFEYLVVDEFQDTSEIQFEIVRKIINDDFSKLFCVGDSKQAIYGFRGGELGVFNECSKLVSQNLTMSNNYRSEDNIIQFNNLLFENIFPKGNGFVGKDLNAVDVVYQKYPLENIDSGKLNKVKVDVTNNTSTVTSSEMDFIEAHFLAQKIKENYESTNENFCILYSKLTPSKLLTDELMKMGIGFVAQVKVAFSEDPIICIFRLFVEAAIVKNKNEQYVDSINTYLEYLEADNHKITNELVNDFINDVKSYNLLISFNRILFKLGISNQNYEQNLKIVEQLCIESNGELNRVLTLITKYKKERYSFDFRYGTNPNRVKIMSAHASKGLEFDHVLLGGIHTNGVDRGDSTDFGKLPWSFTWKKNFYDKEKFKSPQYLFEQSFNKKKNLSEAKRLFYVACTRAKKQLTWVDLNGDKGPLKYGSNSWIEGIRSWENDIEQKSEKIRSHILEHDSSTTYSCDDSNFLSFQDEATSSPLFHKNNLSIAFVDNQKFGQKQQLGISAELSVTKLATLLTCPRKFYLKNILKLEEDESFQDLNDQLKLTKEERVDNEEVLISSSERGTLIHEDISKMIKNNLIIPLSSKNENKKILEYVKKELEQIQGVFFSEEPLKFDFFGQMLTGIPDLYILKDGNVEIWDFKTGKSNPEKLLPYWFQLMAYGIALKNLKLWTPGGSITLKLMFVDEEKVLEKNYSYDELIEQMSESWLKLGQTNQVNLKHCRYCSYGNLCHFSSEDVAQQ